MVHRDTGGYVALRRAPAPHQDSAQQPSGPLLVQEFSDDLATVGKPRTVDRGAPSPAGRLARSDALATSDGGVVVAEGQYVVATSEVETRRGRLGTLRGCQRSLSASVP